MTLFRCVITGNGEAAYMYLGRPWEPFGRVVFAETFMDRCIEPAGWHNWDKPDNEQTACFYEYRSQPCVFLFLVVPEHGCYLNLKRAMSLLVDHSFSLVLSSSSWLARLALIGILRRCSGPGSSSSGRERWCKELFGDEAMPFLAQTFIDPDIENPWLVHRLGTPVPVSASSLE
jgi:pectinesterase